MSNISASDRVFRYSPYMRWFMFVGTVFFAWMAIAMFVFVQVQDGGSAYGLFFLVFALLSAYLFYGLSTKVVVNQTEIRKIYWFGREKRLAWMDVAFVEGKDFDGSQLKLMDLHHETTIYIEPHLNGYEEIIDFMRSRRPDLWRAPVSLMLGEVKQFDRLPFVYIVFIGLILSCSITGTIGIAQGYAVNGLLALGFGFWTLWLLAGTPLRVSLQGSNLHLRYLLREKSIEANEITSISLSVYRGLQGETSQAIEVHLKTGKPISLSAFKPGTPILYNTLRAWWETHIPPAGENDEHNRPAF